MKPLGAIIEQYQTQQSPEAAEELLTRLAPLEDTLYLLIRRGVGAFSTQRGSILLSEIRHPRGLGAAQSWLMSRASRYSEDELRQEIRLSILQCLSEFRYMYGYLERTLARNLKELFGVFEQEYQLDEDRVADSPLERMIDLSILEPDERSMLEVYVANDLDAGETSDQLGLTRRQLRYRLRKAFEKLRNNAKRTEEHRRPVKGIPKGSGGVGL
jgi:DNA-directed RNA polymerase specialized sigma24 family protein